MNKRDRDKKLDEDQVQQLRKDKAIMDKKLRAASEDLKESREGSTLHSKPSGLNPKPPNLNPEKP